MLPAPGGWALGREAEAQAEALLLEARRLGLRTAWLGPEAGFVSNLSVLENLRLVHDWHAGEQDFGTALQAALSAMDWHQPDWLLHRPAQLTEARQRQARLLRVWLMQPGALVVAAGAASDAVLERLRGEWPHARFFLLDEASANWPPLNPHAILDASSGEPTA